MVLKGAIMNRFLAMLNVVAKVSKILAFTVNPPVCIVLYQYGVLEFHLTHVIYELALIVSYRLTDVVIKSKRQKRKAAT
jgi:hypothetical protein